jgi:homoserine kinase
MTMSQSADFSEIVVPASTANLGPGLDTLAVAVQLYTRVKILDVLPTQPNVVETIFADGQFSGENRIETAFRYAHLRGEVQVPGVRIEVRSDIPRRAGLGSSAAATVAGLKLYGLLTSPKPVADWLALASEVEGHPDNAAASLFGGMTMSCQFEDGRVTAHAWRWPEAVHLIVATPDVPLDTAYARSVLPGSIRMRDAVFNLQRTVLLIRALETGRYDELREAMRDRWHQPYRLPLVPALKEALELEQPGLVGVCLSGAGPSILALATDHEAEIRAALTALYDRLALSHTIRTLRAHQPEANGGADLQEPRA